ncbi:MAG TPA: ImmA/IrrE family metallo-endopeptidase [Thermoanaerobaculia bacterium]
MLRVEVKPELLRWAVERSRIDALDLTERFPQFEAWISKEVRPTLKQLERFARATHAPVGFLFLSEPPPADRVPIPDFRTVADREVGRPSPNLLDTIYQCQVRQDWYRDYAVTSGYEPLSFVGTLRVGDDVTAAAGHIRNDLGFDLEARRQAKTWAEAFRLFIEQLEAHGVLTMVSGIVGSNTRRTLDPEEFRGFALADPLAPLVFVNGADTLSARMFTLAHEVVHIWIGQSAVSDADVAAVPKQQTERWCNRVAAELLVPLELFRLELDPRAELAAEMKRLAKQFKVSTLVVLRRMHDAGTLPSETYWTEYQRELARLRAISRASGGGSFYRTQPARLGKRFTSALIADTLEGNTLFRDAYRMLGISKESTFRELGTRLRVL